VDWGLGIGPNPQSPIPNPQSPIPNPQESHLIIIDFSKLFLLIKILLFQKFFKFISFNISNSIMIEFRQKLEIKKILNGI